MMKRLLLVGLTCLFVSKASAQCKGISLTSNKTEICAPGLIEFKVIGAPAGSAYQWDVGQGTINGVDTIYGFYQQAQKVNASVRITFPNGQTCSLSEQNMVEVHGTPQPSYTLSRKLLCDGPDTVSFKNTTPNARSVSWVIDGTNYSDQGDQVTHKYSTEGKKDLFLIIIDNNGCRGILNEKAVVDVRVDVQVDFMADHVNGCVPQTVQLKSTSATFGENIIDYKWNFEGQKSDTSSLQTPAKLVYDLSGKYGVKLEVTTDQGCVHTVDKPEYLQFGDTTSLDIQISDTALCLGEQINLKTSTELPGSYVWIMPGATDTIELGKSEQQLTYGASGIYDIGLWYSHNACVSKTIMKDKVVVNEVEVDFVSTDNYHCKLPHVTHLKNKTKFTGSGKVSYTWTYFKHRTREVVATSNTFNDNRLNEDWAMYDVQLVATHENGCTDTMEKEQFIRVDSIRPAVYARPRVACVDQTISFHNATPRASYMSQDTFYWKFFKKDKSLRYTAKGAMVQHSYSDTGLYDVIFYAGNTIGCRDSVVMENYVDIIIPELEFKVKDPTICVGEALELEAVSKPTRANFEYFWKIESTTNSTVHIESDTNIFEPHLNTLGEYKLSFYHHLAGGCKDSAIEKDLIKVNGVVGSIVLDSSEGCSPFQTGAKFKVLENYHYGSPSDKVSITWDGLAKFDIDDKHADHPIFTVKEDKQVRAYAYVQNSTGCEFASNSHMITTGVVADIGHLTSKICVGQPFGIRDASNIVANRSEWNILPNNFKATVVPNDTGVSITPLEAGLFTIQLVASRNNMCSDTVEYHVESQEVISDFIAIDTHLFCAPVYAQFQAKSVGADSFLWSFGDGTTIASVDRNIANIYNKNSGWSDGFDIQLISKNKLGCADTIVKNDLVKVLGPIPEFVMENNYGCDPLEVKFVDKSRDVHSYLMDYRDGTTLDSTGLFSHTYTIENSGDRQSYRPALYAKDSLGCVAIFEPNDLVSVLRRPEIALNIPDPEGCEPHSLYFDHDTKNASDAIWSLDGQTISSDKSGNVLLDTAGQYTLKLEITNNNLCSDSAFIPIKIHKSPQIEIITDSIPCMNKVVNFSVKGDSATRIEHFLWNFDDGQGTTNLHRLPKTATTYTEPGDKKVTLTIVDENQCSFKAQKKLTISDPNNIVFPMIKQVSVNANHEIEIEWFEVKDSAIKYNQIFKDGFVDANGNPAPYYEQANNASHNLLDKNVDVTTPNCYTMINIDQCDFESKTYAPHCPVILSLEKSGPSKLRLTWTHYKGWLEVQGYDIYRSNEGSDFELLISVEGYINEFEDQFLCTGEYRYYVVAKYRDRRSRSNTVADEPIFIHLKDRPFVKNVTVKDNGTIEVRMNPVENPNWEAHVLTKYNADKSQVLDVIETYEDIYIDDNANISNESYVYQLAEKDRCGAVTLPGFTGKSILIKGEYVDDKSILNWNSYEKWEKGVENYHLQIKNNDGEFVELAELAPSQLVYHDGDPHVDINDEHCFRIMALSRSEIPDTSYSNTVCTMGPSKVWVPNAFTPNDDGKNDVFKPVGQFLKDFEDGSYREYSMTIYNSWGQKLFETHDIQEAWDGTYLGELMVQDSYFYKIEISGVDEKVFRKNGSVILLK